MLTTTDLRNLGPELIYRFSTFFQEFLEVHGLQEGDVDFHIIPTFFNKRTRTFHWIALHPSMWEVSENSEGLKRFKKILESVIEWKQLYPDLWIHFLDELPHEIDIYKKSWETIDNLTVDILNKENNYDLLHRAVLMLYSGYHQHAEKNIEGLYYRWLNKCKGKFRYTHPQLIGRLTPGKDESKQFNWYVFDDYKYPKCKTDCYHSGNCACEEVNHKEGEGEYFLCCNGGKCSFEKFQSLHDETKQYSNIGNQETPQITYGPYKTLVNDILLQGLLMENLKEKLIKTPYIIIVPIYDVGIGPQGQGGIQGVLTDHWKPNYKYGAWLQGYGGIQGVLTCYFNDREKRNDWHRKNWDVDGPLRLSRAMPSLAREISASSEIWAGSIAIHPPYDLVSHFLHCLIYVQDWESAVVFKNKQCQYTFIREKIVGSFKYDWQRKGQEKDTIETIPIGEGSPIHESRAQQSNRFIRQSLKKDKCPCHHSFDFNDIFYIWWFPDLWLKELIPGLNAEEILRYKDISIRFQFPSYYIIPKNVEEQKVFAHAYLRQQLSLMRMLIPKVRARRAALRSAVSAIMGRNMSHNIGSHVLARYSSAAGRVSEQRTITEGESAVESGAEDHRSVFLRYMQRRMDFIAEVATTEKSFWEQPLNFRGVLSVLNLADERRRINKRNHAQEQRQFEPILLSYISGKPGIKVSVETCDFKGHDPYFACPGGEVGAHAFYVILENIIRNSARHNKGDNIEQILLKVQIEESLKNNLWCVTVIDSQSSPDKIDEINTIISEKPILNEYGSPDPKYWGIREMQVCAQYLRGLPMSDLEGEATNPLVLEAIAYNHEDNLRLAYRMFLQRAKLCAVISTKEKLAKGHIGNNLEKLRSMGIELLPELPEVSMIQGYGFMIVDDTVAKVDGNMLVSSQKQSVATPIPLIHLPIRTFVVDNSTLENLLLELREKLAIDPFRPEDWLDTLYRLLWIRYRDRHNTWRGKTIVAYVGWEDACPASCPIEGQFTHKPVGLLPNSDAGKIHLYWVEHASHENFDRYHVPNLLSAAKNTGESYKPDIIYAEMIESLSPHKSLLEQQKANGTGEHELIAAALARVIILDERVQNEMGRIYRSNLIYRTIWTCAGILVPMVDKTNLNYPDFLSIHNYLKKPSDLISQMPPDFFVIHLTILENLREPKDKSEADTLKRLLAGTSAEQGCETVIVTGRGAPTFSRHNRGAGSLQSRYLPVSALLEYLLARPSKLALMRALWNSATQR